MTTVTVTQRSWARPQPATTTPPPDFNRAFAIGIALNIAFVAIEAFCGCASTRWRCWPMRVNPQRRGGPRAGLGGALAVKLRPGPATPTAGNAPPSWPRLPNALLLVAMGGLAWEPPGGCCPRCRGAGTGRHHHGGGWRGHRHQHRHRTAVCSCRARERPQHPGPSCMAADAGVSRCGGGPPSRCGWAGCGWIRGQPGHCSGHSPHGHLGPVRVIRCTCWLMKACPTASTRRRAGLPWRPCPAA